MLETSRSIAVKSSVLKVPKIEHPLTLLSKVQGNNSLNPFTSDNNEGRSIGCEDESKYKSRKNNGSRTSHRESGTESLMDGIDLSGTFLTNIADNVKVVENPKTTKLPVFGSRSALVPRSSMVSRQHSSDELKNSAEISERFQKKILSNYYEIRKKFIDNDPENKGNVTREGLMRVLQLSTGFHITNNCLNNLLQLWRIKIDKQIFSFAEINAIFIKRSDTNDGNFIDPVYRQVPKPIEPSKISSVEAFDILKEKFKLRELYLTDLFPDAVKSQKFVFDRNDMKNALYRIMIGLIPTEMDKLWLKFDTAKQGSIDGMKFLKQIGIISQPMGSLTPRIKGQTDCYKESSSNSNSLENLLRLKLREGFTDLGRDFQKKDIYQTGFVSNDDFLQVLADNDLHLEKNLLPDFLQRCIIVPTKDGISYQDFLVRFQDRSEAGITHKVLLRDKNDSKIIELDSVKNPFSIIEMKLINLFQKDFLELLRNFRKCDKNDSGAISIMDFRKIIEKKLNVDFTEQQFKSIVDSLQLNKNLEVPYLDFLKQFDTGNFTPFLFDNEIEPTFNKPENSTPEAYEENYSGKSINDIRNAIKNVVLTRYQDVEKAFREIDEYNSNTLTQETMYQMFKKVNIKPELSRGDIREVWKIFILNERKALDFKEFVRHFTYRKSEASFPNSKLFPPTKGDADYMQRSRKLNAVSDILLDNVRSKIELLYHDLVKEFSEKDKNNTGEVDLDYFQDVLKELNIHLNECEIGKICEKFKCDGRKISYAQLLKPFSIYKLPNASHQSHLNSHTSCSDKDLKSSLEIDKLIGDVNKKLQVLTQSAMKRSIKRIDSTNSGTIPISELRALLLLQGVSLNEDEVYSLMSRYDVKLNGTVNYQHMLREIDHMFE